MNTTDLIVGLVLIVILGFAGYKTWQRLTGKVTCCGGPKENVPTKKISDIIGTKEISIEGMHCSSCKNSVLKGLQALEGVSAKVSVENKSAVVSFNREVSDEELIQAVEDRGFQVLSIATR